MSKLKWLIALVGMSMMAACGGGGGDDSTDSLTGGDDQITTQSIQGAVADGYLENATVFCDLDGDLTWDDNEPKTLSGKNGYYLLNVVDRSACTVIAKAEAGITIDSDAPGQPVAKAFTFSAPVAPEGKDTFVSPISTLVKERMRKGQTLEDAFDSVKLLLGVTEGDLLADYISGGNTQLHETAQAITKVMAQVQEICNDASSNLSGPAEVMETIVSKIEIDIDAITTDPSYDPLLAVTSEMVSGKSFILMHENLISQLTFNSDQTTEEWANDYDTASLPVPGSWEILNGVLQVSDNYGVGEYKFLGEQEGALVFATKVTDQGEEPKWATIRMIEIKPISQDNFLGRTYTVVEDGPESDLNFNSDGSLSEDGKVIGSWEIVSDTLLIDFNENYQADDLGSVRFGMWLQEETSTQYKMVRVGLDSEANVTKVATDTFQKN